MVCVILGILLQNHPSEDGACVSMCEYKGHILMACQYAIYQLSEKDDTFKKIKFEFEVKDWK